MERLSSKILVSSLFVALSVIIIAAVILESRYIQSVDESITVNKPGFATPTPKPIVKVEKTPTPTPTPEPTPTPTIPDFGGLFMAEISSETGFSPAEINVLSYEKKDFNNSSLECPKPGEMYAQVITPGWVIIFEAGNKEFEFHSDLDGNYYVNCSTIDWSNSENITEKYKFWESNQIIINRRNDGNYKELRSLNEDEIGSFISTIDVNILKQEKVDCIFLYEILFIKTDEVTTMLAVCSNGESSALILEEPKKYFSLPDSFMNKLGELSAILPMPGKPKLETAP